MGQAVISLPRRLMSPHRQTPHRSQTPSLKPRASGRAKSLRRQGEAKKKQTKNKRNKNNVFVWRLHSFETQCETHSKLSWPHGAHSCDGTSEAHADFWAAWENLLYLSTTAMGTRSPNKSACNMKCVNLNNADVKRHVLGRSWSAPTSKFISPSHARAQHCETMRLLSHAQKKHIIFLFKPIIVQWKTIKAKSLAWLVALLRLGKQEVQSRCSWKFTPQLIYFAVVCLLFALISYFVFFVFLVCLFC